VARGANKAAPQSLASLQQAVVAAAQCHEMADILVEATGLIGGVRSSRAWILAFGGVMNGTRTVTKRQTK